MSGSAAFEAFYLKHHHSLYKLVYRYVSSPQDCENIVQDVFLELLEDFTSIAEEQRLMWVYNKARNKRRSFVRSEQRHRKRAEHAQQTKEKHQRPHDYERRDLIQKALLQMPSDKADLLELYHLSGFSQEEMAQILQVKPSSLSKLLQRAEQYFLQAFQSLQVEEPGESSTQHT